MFFILWVAWQIESGGDWRQSDKHINIQPAARRFVYEIIEERTSYLHEHKTEEACFVHYLISLFFILHFFLFRKDLLRNNSDCIVLATIRIIKSLSWHYGPYPYEGHPQSQFDP